MNSELLEYVKEVGVQFLDDLDDAAEGSRNFGDVKRGARLVTEALNRCLGSLTATGLTGDAIRTPSATLWQVAGEPLRHGELQTRAREKPRGYAGDDVLLRQICQKYVCNHPLGRCFDLYFQSQAAPVAVRNRVNYAGQAIAERARRSSGESFHVACVGAGPAVEIEVALRELAPEAAEETPLRVTLLDLDQQALDASERQLASILGKDCLRPMRENLFRLPRLEAAQQAFAGVDFIVCLGFFDYLRDEEATAMLRLFWERLQPGGRMIVGNFSPACTTRAYMEWIADWFLIYRDGDELERLAERAGVPHEAFRITKEATGAVLMLDAVKV